MTNQEIHLRLMEAAITGFCANPYWRTDEEDLTKTRVESAAQIADAALIKHLERWAETPQIKNMGTGGSGGI